MKKFRNKKSPDGVNTSDEARVMSPPPTSPGLKKSSTSRWRKNKKAPEPKPELDIAAALPPTDDFRTSLLMPNLSARFSMLREQDDPNSLLGKASDDSVLQPWRRQSRLNGLNDIAEVSSINSATRRPFAENRHGSYGSEDGWASDNDISHGGSVMSRARPGEGNVLFGGRQKVYKIPVTGSASTSKLGRPVYEDDIGMSAFQRYRKEREEGAQDWPPSDDPTFDFGLDQNENNEKDHTLLQTANDSAKDLTHSTSVSSHDKKRSTASSSARSEARSSTAATSITSQPAAHTTSPPTVPAQQPTPAPSPAVTHAPSMPNLKRADPKTRRLYEQGLNEHIQEQQSSALSRLNSLHRQRSVKAPPALYSARSTGNLVGLKSQQTYPLRSKSPPAPLMTFGSIRESSSANGSPLTSGPQSPVSPQGVEFPELTQALEPGDRGKATAMGAFNKPKQSFDEQQYLERQQQLQRSQSKTGIRKDHGAQSAFHQRFNRYDASQPARERSVSGSSVQQRVGRFEHIDRERSASNASSARSRSRSAPKKHEPSKAYSVFQHAAEQMSATVGSQHYDTHRTFFGNISASDSEEEEEETHPRYPQYNQPSEFNFGPHTNRWQPTLLPVVSEHPASRGHASKPSLAEEDEDAELGLEPEPLRPTASTQAAENEEPRRMLPTQTNAVDSPTLGPSNAEPLTGLVHHLRQESNQSSIYPEDNTVAEDVPEMPEPSMTAISPVHTDRGVRISSRLDSDSRVESTYTNSNPWDLDDVDNAYGAQGGWERQSFSPVEGGRNRAQSASRTPSLQTSQPHGASEVSDNSPAASTAPWQQELRKQHTRDASTATQQEREAFANELAARSNAIRENMKSIVERETGSRAVSPARSATGTFKGLGMLRAKSSRESVVGREPIPNKALKMLGLGANASANHLPTQQEHNGFSFDFTRPRQDSEPRPSLNPNNQPLGPAAVEAGYGRARGNSEASHANSQSPAPSQSGGMRSRSNSELTTSRSRSRPGRYRDDLEKAMAEGTGSRATSIVEVPPFIPHELTPRPSPDMASSPFDGQPRARSNSRLGGAPGYFDTRNTHHPPPPSLQRLAPSVPTPTTLSPNVYSPGVSPMRSSPAVSPIIQTPTPPLSGANTPIGSTFTSPPVPIIQPRQGALRKKTISKSSISVPTLISTTSNVDTIDLPEGASLRNGMDELPPVPELNPKRRANRKVFANHKSRGDEPQSPPMMSEAAQRFGNYGRSKTPDPWTSKSTGTEPDFDAVRNPRAYTPGVDIMAARRAFENHSNPTLAQYGLSHPAMRGGTTTTVSTGERVERSPVPVVQSPSLGTVEGGMF